MKGYLPSILAAVFGLLNPMFLWGAASDNYKVEVLQSQPFQKSLVRRGQVNYLDEIALSFKTAGYIEELNVEVGDKVTQGDTLISLEASELVYQAQALTYRLDFTAKEKTRIAKLHNQGLLPKSALDGVEADYNQLSENLKEVTYLLMRTRLSAPTTGVISKRLVNIGELIGAGSPVVTIVSDEDNRIATFWLSESEIPLFNQDDSVKLIVTQNNNEIQGKVYRIAVMPNASGLYRMDVMLTDIILAGSNIELVYKSALSQVFAISHHTPVAINANQATVLLKSSEGYVKEQFNIESMDEDFIYLQTDKFQVEVVVNGWISR